VLGYLRDVMARLRMQRASQIGDVAAAPMETACWKLLQRG